MRVEGASVPIEMNRCVTELALPVRMPLHARGKRRNDVEPSFAAPSTSPSWARPPCPAERYGRRLAAPGRLVVEVLEDLTPDLVHEEVDAPDTGPIARRDAGAHLDAAHFDGDVRVLTIFHFAGQRHGPGAVIL